MFRPGRDRFVRTRTADVVTPTITAVTPNDDRTPGGIALTITGTSFLSGATVLVGAVAATSVVVVDAATITCTAPANAEGAYDLTVTNPSGALAVAAQALSYVAGHITGVTPPRGLTAGGQTVTLTGVNFVTGSTITFGGAAATAVVFVDSRHYYCTTPSHADGTVDIVLTEPGAATVTARHGFVFTSRVFGEDIRRRPSITIESTLNRGANTAAFTIDGSGTPPIGGEKVIFTDETTLVFAGTVQRVEQVIEERPENMAWRVQAVDHTARFNRLRPFAVYHHTRVSQIIQELVARFAPGFTTEYVQTNLPRVSITLDGEQDFSSILNMLCDKIGNGHWYLDYSRRVHFFQSPSPTVYASSLTVGPGTAMTVSESPTSSSGYGLVPGYYYFFSQFVYGTAKTYTTPSVPTPSGYVQLSDQAADRNLQGDISNGQYVNPGQPLWPRGWVGYDGAGVQKLEGSGWIRPLNAGDVYFATPDVATALENATPGFQSALSPMSNLIFLDQWLPAFAGVPVGPVVGGLSCSRRNIFAVRYGDRRGPGGMPLQGYAAIADNVTTAATLAPAPSFAAPVQGQPTPPFPPPGVPSASESATLNAAASYLAADGQPGYWSFAKTCVYQDGTESRASVQTGPVLLDGRHQVTLTNLPIGRSINGVPVAFDKFYACCFTPNIPIVYGLPDFTQGGSTLMAISTDLTADTLTFPMGSLSGGDRQPSNVPPGMEDTPGPDLERTDAPTDVTDTNPWLLLDPPPTWSCDDSQLRNRVYVKGKGSIVTQDAAIGATEIGVADVSTFVTPSGGGRVILGSRILSYTSLSGAAGAGAIRLSSPLSQPVIQSDWLFGGGLPVRPFVQVDDLASQKARGAIETDDDGNPTDGVHEFTIADDTLATFEQMFGRGSADVRMFAWPIETFAYATREPTRPGQTVHVDLTTPPVFGDFVIQDVTIDQVHDVSDTLAPRYMVSAAPFKQELSDVLLGSSRDGGGGSVSMAGVSGNSGSVGIQTRSFRISNDDIKQMWWDGTYRGTPFVLVPGIQDKILFPLSMILHSFIPTAFNSNGWMDVMWIGFKRHDDEPPVTLMDPGGEWVGRGYPGPAPQNQIITFVATPKIADLTSNDENNSPSGRDVGLIIQGVAATGGGSDNYIAGTISYLVVAVNTADTLVRFGG